MEYLVDLKGLLEGESLETRCYAQGHVLLAIAERLEAVADSLDDLVNNGIGIKTYNGEGTDMEASLKRIADLMEKEQRRRVCPHCQGELKPAQMQGPARFVLFCAYCECAFLADGSVYVAACEKGAEADQNMGAKP